MINLTLLPDAVSHPDGDAVHFDVLHGAANEVIERLRGLGLDQRGSVVLENVDTSISAHADRVAARRARYQQFTPVWAEVDGRISLEGSFPPIGDHHPGGIGRRGVAGLRRRQRGPGLGSPAPAQRRGPDGCRVRRNPGAAGDLAADCPAGRDGPTTQPAANRRVMA
ncbi:MAG TPA: hypothetical protein VMI73_15450 [Trebonia sp.]|nr:hypothetical protein [Trebonia sp.]